ncbi:PREDICTED: uncharacterized protein LOC105566900, partial [Vollenhovia emeryi]|uniref:uncharacterized protein LOC105566900 n=1 Tax=Vollenhovia emeryi TaxID=411798 RepID=UPI0005F3B3EE
DNAFLCETCFRKVESCVNFRCQLVASFARLNDAQMPDLDLPGLENASITGASLISKASDTDSDASKEITNANESKVAYDLDRRSCSEADNDSSCADMPLNFHRGDVDSASNCGSDIGDDLSADPDDVAFYSKIQKSDIESEVNVCSGEDDQVLELSVNYEHNEMSNVSSAESEEECDYGPTFKKIKLSNQISSPPILS